MLFTNEPELAVLSRSNAQAEHAPDLLGDPGALAIEPLLQQGVGTIAVKLGPRGCLVANSGTQHRELGFSVEAIDTNGCGDAFVAGFLFAHLRGAALEQCASLANAIGALQATRLGAAEALPARATLRAFLGQSQGHASLTDLLSPS